MEDSMTMLNWNEYRGQLAAGVKELGGLSPAPSRDMSKSAPLDRAKICSEQRYASSSLWRSPLPRAAMAASVHSDAAIRHGATKEEIAEALGVAVAVNAGAALIYSTRVMDAIKEHPSTTL
jgi:hypothetical protein